MNFTQYIMLHQLEKLNIYIYILYNIKQTQRGGGGGTVLNCLMYPAAMSRHMTNKNLSLKSFGLLVFTKAITTLLRDYQIFVFYMHFFHKLHDIHSSFKYIYCEKREPFSYILKIFYSFPIFCPAVDHSRTKQDCVLCIKDTSICMITDHTADLIVSFHKQRVY